ncbi:MAG: hypothetical protein H7A46_17055 [Verrucomicrobiales bacterium]|nr:hypothetical protein [Verrucomicrobiales bacterium]
MVRRGIDPVPFAGFPDFRANVTFTPIQFFTVVIPHCQRTCIRVIGCMLRRVLGWVDEHGNPTREQLRFSLGELSAAAGVSRASLWESFEDKEDKKGVEFHCLRRINTPHRDLSGCPAVNGLYELCWDHEGDYTDSSDEFRGFYYPEAAVLPVSDGDRVVHRPKAARKNIPNAFFDYLLPREPLAVIRVVGALLFYSIEWGPGGERKVPVTKSITELAKLTRLSRQRTHAGVKRAREQGYIVAVGPGCFDPAAGQSSRAATYAIRWTKEAAVGAPAGAPRKRRLKRGGNSHRANKVNGAATRPIPADRTKIVNEGPVQKSERNRSRKVNGDRANKVNGISIKKDLKTTKAAAAHDAVPETPHDPSAAAVVAAVELLTKTGFDRPTANRLVRAHSADRVQRQVQWLPLRRPSRNRLGMLRRAIEEDWPKPEGEDDSDPRFDEARTFAAHYYAAYHRLEGPAATEPFAKDLQTAAEFLERLPATEPRPVAEWGRRFGRFMREKHAGDAHAKPNLSLALVPHGDGFLRLLQRETQARHQKALGKARAAHEAAFSGQWQAYVMAAEVRLQGQHAALYATFVQERDRQRHAMTGGRIVASAETLARFDADSARLQAFAEFFRNHPDCPVLDFWQWDQQLNPERFGTKTGSASDLTTAEVRS